MRVCFSRLQDGEQEVHSWHGVGEACVWCQGGLEGSEDGAGGKSKGQGRGGCLHKKKAQRGPRWCQQSSKPLIPTVKLRPWACFVWVPSGQAIAHRPWSQNTGSGWGLRLGSWNQIRAGQGHPDPLLGQGRGEMGVTAAGSRGFHNWTKCMEALC